MKFIDLTREIRDGSVVYPGQPELNISKHYNLKKDGRNLEKISMSSHFGTHIDSPFHFIDEGNTIDKINIEKLSGKTYVMEFQKSKGETIELNEIKNHKEAIKKHKRIIIKTGWEKKGEVFYQAYPVLSTEATQFIADQHPYLLGMDTPSPGPKGEKGNLIHKILLKNEIVILEGLTNLKEIKKEIFTMLCIPLKLYGTSGAPCRVLALK